jgi:hypothetical protein
MRENNVRLRGFIRDITTDMRGRNKGVIDVMRKSGNIDSIPFTYDIGGLKEGGGMLEFLGRIRTTTFIDKDGVRHKNTSVRVMEVIEPKDCEEMNEVTIKEAYIVNKNPVRVTPRGFAIIDVVIAINDGRNSDYPNIIAWGSNAYKLNELPVGTKISLEGRFQSRQYNKQLDDMLVVRTTHEISVNKVTVYETEQR